MELRGWGEEEEKWNKEFEELGMAGRFVRSITDWQYRKPMELKLSSKKRCDKTLKGIGPPFPNFSEISRVP